MSRDQYVAFAEQTQAAAIKIRSGNLNENSIFTAKENESKQGDLLESSRFNNNKKSRNDNLYAKTSRRQLDEDISSLNDKIRQLNYSQLNPRDSYINLQ